MKQNFDRFWNYKSFGKALRFLIDRVDLARVCALKPLIKVANMIDSIMIHPITNAASDHSSSTSMIMHKLRYFVVLVVATLPCTGPCRALGQSTQAGPQSQKSTAPEQAQKTHPTTGASIDVDLLISPDRGSISTDFLDSLDVDPSVQPQVQAALNAGLALLKKVQATACGFGTGKIPLIDGKSVCVAPVPAKSIKSAFDLAIRRLPKGVAGSAIEPTLRAAFEQHLNRAFGNGYEISMTIGSWDRIGGNRVGRPAVRYIISVQPLADGKPAAKAYSVPWNLSGTRFDIFELQPVARPQSGAGNEQPKPTQLKPVTASTQLPVQTDAGKVHIGYEVFARLLDKGSITLPVFDGTTGALSQDFIAALQLEPSEEKEVLKAALLFETNWRNGEVKRSSIETDSQGESKLRIADMQGQRDESRQWALVQFSNLLDGPRNRLMSAAFQAQWNSHGDAVLLSISELKGNRFLHVETLGSNGVTVATAALPGPSDATFKDFPRWRHLDAVIGQRK